MVKTVEQWLEIFNTLPSPSTETVEVTIARRVLWDVNSNTNEDVENVANAMQAYAHMMFEYGLKP